MKTLLIFAVIAAISLTLVRTIDAWNSPKTGYLPLGGFGHPSGIAAVPTSTFIYPTVTPFPTPPYWNQPANPTPAQYVYPTVTPYNTPAYWNMAYNPVPTSSWNYPTVTPYRAPAYYNNGSSSNYSPPRYPTAYPTGVCQNPNRAYPFAPTERLESVFSLPGAFQFDNQTLSDAASFSDDSGTMGSVKILLRTASNALLSGYYPTRDSATQLIADVDNALKSGDSESMLRLALRLQTANNNACMCQNQSYNPCDGKGGS